MVVRLYCAMDNLPVSTHQAERLLDGLPEPLADADQRLAQADRLLKSGVDPDELEVAMRREGLKLRPAPSWAEQLTLCDKGVVLGTATVIVGLAGHPYGGTGFDLEGNEAGILALLSIARCHLAPTETLSKLAAASRALAAGETARAAITLAQIGQPPMTDERLAKSLQIAAVQLRKGANPFDLLKAARLMPFVITSSDWLKTLGNTTGPVGASNFDESKHPRGSDGKFVDGDSAGYETLQSGTAEPYRPDESATSSQAAQTGKASAVVNGHDVEIRNPDGSVETRTGGTRAWRNNNPGNIIAGDFANAHGAIGSDGKFAIFPDAETGMKAVETLLGTRKYSETTIDGAIHLWAPPKENDTQNYQRLVGRITGLPGDTPMKQLTAEERGRVARAIQRVEGWKAGTVSVKK